MKPTLSLFLAAFALAATMTLAQDAAPQARGEFVYERPAGGVMPPKIVHQTFPQYTDRARKRKIQGVVTLSLIVTPEGSVRDLKVTKSLDQYLDKQALECVSNWKFQPATKDGQPVTMRIAVEIDFHLR